MKISCLLLDYRIHLFGCSAALFGCSVLLPTLASVESLVFKPFTGELSIEQPPGSLTKIMLCQFPSVISHSQSQHSLPITVRLWMPPCLSSCSFIWSRKSFELFASHWQQIWTPWALKREGIAIYTPSGVYLHKNDLKAQGTYKAGPENTLWLTEWMPAGFTQYYI